VRDLEARRDPRAGDEAQAKPRAGAAATDEVAHVQRAKTNIAGR
jgi:hypothetical protein